MVVESQHLIKSDPSLLYEGDIDFICLEQSSQVRCIYFISL